jgi:hypothetical protein
MPANEKDMGFMKNGALMDSEYPRLDNNDVYLYQHILERFMERNAITAGPQIAMLACLCAQARRANNAQTD